jgi:translation initiation factor IF-3
VSGWICKWRPDLPPERQANNKLPGPSAEAASEPPFRSLRVFARAWARLSFWGPRSAGALDAAIGFRTFIRTGGLISTEPRINDRIRVPEVRLVGPAGEQVGIVRIEDALRLASEAELDLVEVAPMARPPVAKLMDYGKFKYESAQKARESRRHQTNTVIKEMKLRPKIDSHDYETKKGHVVRFLKAGDKVKITIMFRGREQSRPELGYNLLKRLAEDVDEFGFVESAPKQDGRNMLMVLSPLKKKVEARAEVRAERDRRAAERQADAEAERSEAAASRARAAAQPAAKKRRGPADNLDPDVDLI